MLTRIYFILSMLFIIVGCSSKNGTTRITNKPEGFYEEGVLINDSVFHGLVTRYDLNGRCLSYGNYWYGLKNGIYINKYINGITEDSINFRYGLKDGFSFKFDTLGNMIYKANYLQNKSVGGVYIFDTSGRIKEYNFRNFEGESIYTIKYNKSDTSEIGIFPSYKCDTIKVDDKYSKIHLFLYLIILPDLPMHYEIAKFHNGKVFSSEKITSSQCFYEEDLDILADDYKYAIIASVYNRSKGRDDLKIYVLD